MTCSPMLLLSHSKDRPFMLQALMIEMKRKAGRQRDLVDIEILEAIKTHREQ